MLANYPDLCLTCHSDLKAKMYPPAEDGAGAGGTSAGGADTAKAALAKIYVHAPTDLKNCNICHKPHFAAEPALMTKPIQPLCADCHDYQKPSFQQAHINIDAAMMDCSRCHDSHTSTDPKFFKARVHKPFADKNCKDCHITE
jgi:predicted CXXCH cytochrome family protein